MPEKKCRKCKETLDVIFFPKMNLGKYGVGSTCDKCLHENIKHYELKKTPVKKIWVKRKNRINK